MKSPVRVAILIIASFLGYRILSFRLVKVYLWKKALSLAYRYFRRKLR